MKNSGLNLSKEPNKIQKTLIRIILIFYIAMLAFLFAMSLFLYCRVDILDSLKKREILRHQPIPYILMLLAFTAFLYVFLLFIRRILAKAKNPDRFAMRFGIICALLSAFLGAVFIYFSDCVPENDQIQVFHEAEKLLGYSNEELDTAYVENFPRIRGIILAIALTMRIAGDTWQGFRALNCFGAFLLITAILLTIRVIHRNNEQLILTALLLLLFYPIFVYTAFVYGTLLSAAFASWGIYGTAAFQNTGRKRYIVFILIGFPLGMQMHQSAAIALVAAIVYLLFHINNRRKAICYCVLSVCMGAAALGSNAATQQLYSAAAHRELRSDAISAMDYFYMGLTSENPIGGPGSIDGSFTKFRNVYPNDPEAEAKAAREAVLQVTEEYLTGKRSLSFFVRKAEYQWLDPTFGARKTINGIYAHNDTRTVLFNRYYQSSLREHIFKLSVVLEMFVYLFALNAGIYAFRRPDQDAAQTFPVIFFIGGFVFQLLWESLSRYCFPYFIWLIPEAAYSFCLVADAVRTRRHNRCRPL